MQDYTSKEIIIFQIKKNTKDTTEIYIHLHKITCTLCMYRYVHTYTEYTENILQKSCIQRHKATGLNFWNFVLKFYTNLKIQDTTELWIWNQGQLKRLTHDTTWSEYFSLHKLKPKSFKRISICESYSSNVITLKWSGQMATYLYAVFRTEILN